MTKVLFLLPDETMLPYAQEVLAPNYPHIKVTTATRRAAIKIVQDRVSQGLEIVATRAVTATALKQAQLNIAVVTIPITSFDIIRAINEAKAQGKSIAVVAHATMVLGIDFLAEVLGVEIRHYATSYGQDYAEPICEARANGAEVILGGALAVTAAKRLGMPFSLIKIGKESLLQAAQEATQIQAALEIESAKHGFLSTILDCAQDGIITVDREHTITAFNPIAEKLTKVTKTFALGKSIEKILPQLNLEQSVNEGKAFPHSIIDCNGSMLMCNSVPILINDKSFGAVITLAETNRIQKMEAIIRREIYARGHIARFYFKDIIGKSPEITKTIEVAADYAATKSSILILGESGTGKEVFAQSIHNASKRANGPFVAVNCAALPTQILEAELFGYVGGAFTGANKEGKPGLFEVAHGGTIFLDEIAEMDYVNQGRLLRVLQEKTVVRLGSFKVIPIDARVIAATNKDLELFVQHNKFRDDLFYRLNVLRLDLPPLRVRKADISLLANEFLREFSDNSGKSYRLTNDAGEYLTKYSWPGNIRELRNLMERIAAISKTDIINSIVLQGLLKPQTSTETCQSPKEKRLTQEITRALEDANGNLTTAAKALGINRSTLWRRMQRLKLEY